MAASAESFDNCQSSSSIRSFRQFRIQCSPERIYGGPGANSFSPVSFREKLFLSVKKHLCCVLFRGTEFEHDPFSPDQPIPARTFFGLGGNILHLLAYSSCHPPLQMPSFSTLSLRDRDEHQMPVYFTQAAFSIQAPITQREKNPWFQTINALKLSQLHSCDA